MANVMFKRGSQANLNTLIKGSGDRFVDGAFYLTTDTDRLYVAQSASELVELNKSITVIDEVKNLPTSNVDEGQFYYATKENILCIYRGATSGVPGAPKWVQINPDTNDNDNDYVKSFTITRDDSSSKEKGIIYNWTMTQGDQDVVNSSLGLSGSFTISAADIATLGGVAVDIDTTGDVNDNSATLALGGDGADTSASKGTVKIKGGTNTGVAVDGNTITISSEDTLYTMGKAANSASIQLTENAIDNAGSVEFAADETYLTIDKSASNKLTYNHKKSGATAGTYGEAGKTIGHLAAGETASANKGQFKIPKLTVDAAGHVTSVSSETFTLPVDNDTTYTVVAPTAGTGNNAGKITVSIHDGDDAISATSDKILYYNIQLDDETEAKPHYNTESLGHFYTANKINSLM